MFHKLKLRYQLDILVVLALLLFVLFSAFYYFSFRNIMYARVEDRALQVIEQVSYNVTSMAQSVASSAKGLVYHTPYVKELLTSEDPIKTFEAYDQLEQITDASKTSNPNIYSISWVINESRVFTDPQRDDNIVVSKLIEKYQIGSSEFRQAMFTSIVRDANPSFYYFGYIFPIFSTDTKDMPKIGCGIFLLDIQELEKLVANSSFTENSVFAILDQENNVIVANQDFKTGDTYEDIFWDEEQPQVTKASIQFRGAEALAQCTYVEQTGWKIVHIIPQKELTHDLDVMQVQIMALIVIGSLLLVVLGHIIIKNITTPIHMIVDFLQSDRENPLNNRIEIKQQNEIAVISSSINTMLDRVEDMTKEIVDHHALLYEAKLAEQTAELAALQSQINPHFLYNTLNCLSNIGLAYDIPEVSDISVAMSNIYRYSIKGDNIVRLETEVQCIKEYMRIMDIRFNGKFETEYRFDDEVLQLYTLRMILQPIVENAVYHGMELRNQKGKLILDGRIADENLVITVSNNGRGMPEDFLKKLNDIIADYENASLINAEKSSIGLGNINKRIKLQFGRQYGLQVESQEETGTKVTLTLPIIRDR